MSTIENKTTFDFFFDYEEQEELYKQGFRPAYVAWFDGRISFRWKKSESPPDEVEVIKRMRKVKTDINLDGDGI